MDISHIENVPNGVYNKDTVRRTEMKGKKKMKKITAKEAEKIMTEKGLCFGGDGKTFYAVNENGAIYEFDSKRERDEFVKFANNK